jgi:hypothetical protein
VKETPTTKSEFLIDLTLIIISSSLYLGCSIALWKLRLSVLLSQQQAHSNHS